ncbi:hypothetical protein SFRURICE_005240, partial [Spodoptera frugiperda]
VAQDLLLSNHNSHNSRDTFTDNRRINNPITQLTNNIEIHCTEDPTPDTQIVDNTELNTILDIDITPTPQTNQERDTLIDETFQQALEHFKTTSPTNRNYIPKQKPSKNLARIVSYLNQTILPENVDRDTNFNTFQTIIYCAAWTAAKVNGARISLEPREGVRTQKKEYRPKWQRRATYSDCLVGRVVKSATAEQGFSDSVPKSGKVLLGCKCERAMLRCEWATSTGVIPRPHQKPNVFHKGIKENTVFINDKHEDV